MMVMNNIYMENSANFSEEEIGAARNAFLKYDQTQQVNLLGVMPIEEAVAILKHCSLGYVQQLITQLELQGKNKLARQYAHQLGLIYLTDTSHQDLVATSLWQQVKLRISRLTS